MKFNQDIFGNFLFGTILDILLLSSICLTCSPTYTRGWTQPVNISSTLHWALLTHNYNSLLKLGFWSEILTYSGECKFGAAAVPPQGTKKPFPLLQVTEQLPQWVHSDMCHRFPQCKTEQPQTDTGCLETGLGTETSARSSNSTYYSLTCPQSCLLPALIHPKTPPIYLLPALPPSSVLVELPL